MVMQIPIRDSQNGDLLLVADGVGIVLAYGEIINDEYFFAHPKPYGYLDFEEYPLLRADFFRWLMAGKRDATFIHQIRELVRLNQ